MTPTIAAEIDTYLRTGDTDVHHAAWPANNFLARAQQAREDLRGALIAEVLRRSSKIALPAVPSPAETIALTRRKVEPMVRGLFPRAEQDIVLALVERSVVFLTPDSVAEVLRHESFDRSAWDLANLYLGSIGAELLGPDAPAIVGLSQEVTCFVSPACIEEDDPFADYIVHEVAHIFHNCKRHTAGLPFSRRREWLLDIAYERRETFAYACEAYARIVERGARPEERLALARAYGEQAGVSDARCDPEEVAELVLAAASRRNGWKVILAHCRTASPRTATTPPTCE